MKPHNDAARDISRFCCSEHSYPTYQLIIAGKERAPRKNVFKITVLETMKWLRQRFRAFELPSELNMPEPEAYEELDLSRLSSFHLDMGYKLQVFWLPDKGIWTLQLTEPDLGTNPGAADQGRMPVPGRLFETNISYSIITDGVECGFRTVVHEIQGTDSFCEVFRLAVIKYLARNRGLSLANLQLIEEAQLCHIYADIKPLRNWLVEPERMLPAVVFSEYEQMSEAPIPCVQRMDMQQVLSADKARYRGFTPTICPPIKNQDAKPSVPLDISSLTRYRMGCAQFFILPASQRESFIKTTGRHIERDILIMSRTGWRSKQNRCLWQNRARAGQGYKGARFFCTKLSKGEGHVLWQVRFCPRSTGVGAGSDNQTSSVQRANGGLLH